MDIYDKIKKLREEKGMSQEELANKLGYKSKTSIHKIEQKLTDLPLSKVVEFAKALHTTPAYLMGWAEYKTSYDNLLHEVPSNISNKKITYEELIPIEIVEIPMYGKASAGNGYINLEQEIGSYAVPKHIFKKGIFAIRVSGDSMTGIDKSIPDGSTAIVDPELCSDPISLNNKVCIFEYDDETYIKQLIIDKQGIIRLRSFNPEYDDIIVLNVNLLLCKGRVIRTFVENQW